MNVDILHIGNVKKYEITTLQKLIEQIEMYLATNGSTDHCNWVIPSSNRDNFTGVQINESEFRSMMYGDELTKISKKYWKKSLKYLKKKLQQTEHDFNNLKCAS